MLRFSSDFELIVAMIMDCSPKNHKCLAFNYSFTFSSCRELAKIFVICSPMIRKMLRIRILLLLCFVLSFELGFSQFYEGFDDGDFTNNPTWSGDAGEWEVLAGELHLNGLTSGGTSHLSTPSTALGNATWEFNFRLNFNPSSSNYAEVFLASDIANVEGAATGYLVRIGNTTDEISLYYVNGGTKSEIIDGIDNRLNVNTPRGKVRVIRDNSGFWQLFSDTTGTGNNYVLEGTTNHSLAGSSNFFGVSTLYSATRFQWCYFDSINITVAAVVDTIPPTILSLVPTSNQTAQVTWSENVDLVTAENPLNYLRNGSINPLNATVVPGDSTKINLDFGSNTFGICATETFVVSNVQDRASNTMLADTLSFTYSVAGTPMPKSIIITEIMADPSTPSPVCVPAFEYVEIYNRDTIPFDLQGWKISDNGTPRTITNSSFILCPGEYALLCGNAANFVGYNNVIGLGSLPSLNNTGDSLGLRSNLGVLIDSVIYDTSMYHNSIKAQGGWSLELINPTDLCSGSFNWTASNDSCGGTPGAQNSVFSNVQDIIAPSILSITVTSDSTLRVCFDEALDPSSANTASNFVVNNGIGAALSSQIDAGLTCVDLEFATHFSPATLYTLTVSNVSDCKGNNAVDNGTFQVPGPIGFKSIIINEIMADETPLPNCVPAFDYLELYNRDTTAIDLQGWTISDNISGPKVITSTSFILAPGDYAVLCGNAANFVGYNNVIGVSGFPSLNTTNDFLGLRSNTGVLVDTVEYDDSWYQSSTKAQGGWSLELINVSDICATQSNWIASNDTCGGTPGAQNSVYTNAPDTIAPSILSVTVTGTNTLTVCFNEVLDSLSANDENNFIVNNGIGVANLSQISGNLTCVDLTFGAAFATGIQYTLSVSGMADCKGNSGNDNANFLVSGPSRPKAVIINEISAHPDPSKTNLPDAEYVELFNRSNQIWNLGGWTFSDNGSPKTLPNYILLPGAYVLLIDDSDTAKFTGKPYVVLASFPLLNDSGDELGLHDQTGNLIDSVEYDLTTYQNTTKSQGGWSLELINPNDTCAMLGNWIASNDTLGGTPALVNSVYSNVADTIAPMILSTNVVSSNTVEVCFNESMDLASMLNPANYSADNGLGVPISASLAGTGNACVALVFADTFSIGTIYTLTVNNVSDCKLNQAGNLTTTFVLGGNAAPFQIVINEIFPDETPIIANLPEAEYVELYNSGTSVVSLKDWTITDRRDTGTLPAYNLFPGAYIVLCGTSKVANFQSIGVTAIGVSGFPGLNNYKYSLEVYDAAGNLMDFAYYTFDWYHDDSKKDGGWSMERKDAYFTCANADNWAASIDPQGGTPGRLNSAIGTFMDGTPPEVVNVIVTSRTTITVTFSEQMDRASLLDKTNYTVDNGIGQATQVLVGSNYPYSVDLTFGALMDTNLIYCLHITDVMDCPLNTIQTPNEFCFGIPDPMVVGDLIINEILYNPYTGGSDYVELYNNSDKILDLSELYIGEIYPGTDSIFNSKRVSTAQKILLPRSYVCLTADREIQIATYAPIDPAAIFEMSSFPSYDDDEGICVIYKDSATVIDSLHYYDDWAFPNLDDKNGVSLERLDFNRRTQDEDNWHSAASTYNYGTPGYKNSEILVPEGDAEVWLQPETFSPDQDGFDDILAINYHFRTPDWNVRVGVYDNKGRLVRILKENTLVGTERGTWNWDGTTDGLHKADVGIYVILLEAVNPKSGETKSFKLACVLATRF